MSSTSTCPGSGIARAAGVGVRRGGFSVPGILGRHGGSVGSANKGYPDFRVVSTGFPGIIPPSWSTGELTSPLASILPSCGWGDPHRMEMAKKQMIEHLGAQLRKLRGKSGKSQVWVAGEIGGGLTQYCEYEAGTTFPRSDKLSSLADLHGVSCDYLLGRADDPVALGKGSMVVDWDFVTQIREARSESDLATIEKAQFSFGVTNPRLLNATVFASLFAQLREKVTKLGADPDEFFQPLEDV